MKMGRCAGTVTEWISLELCDHYECMEICNACENLWFRCRYQFSPDAGTAVDAGSGTGASRKDQKVLRQEWDSSRCPIKAKCKAKDRSRKLEKCRQRDNKANLYRQGLRFLFYGKLSRCLHFSSFRERSFALHFALIGHLESHSRLWDAFDWPQMQWRPDFRLWSWHYYLSLE